MSSLEHYGKDFKYIVMWQRADSPPGEEPSSIPITDPNMWYHVVQETYTTPYIPFNVRVKASNIEGDCTETAPWVVGYSGEGGIVSFTYTTYIISCIRINYVLCVRVELQ